LVNPEETLKEISERDKWGIPILLLIITSFIGLPGIFLALVATGETRRVLFPPIIGFPLFVGLLLLLTKLLKKAGNSLTFLKLVGYSGIPYMITLILMAICLQIYLLITHQSVISIFSKSPPSILPTIMAIFLAIITIISIRLLLMAVIVSFPSISKKGAFLYFLCVLFFLNCLANIFFNPEDVGKIMRTRSAGLEWTWTTQTIQTK